MSYHKTPPLGNESHPPLAPYWYSDTEAMAYREGYMQASRIEYLTGYQSGLKARVQAESDSDSD